MNGAPSSTWFTTPPDWEWLIVLYFFIGGLAGGSYFLAALIDLVGPDDDRPLARLGYYVAFPCVALSGLVLTVDLGRPERFWHMLVESNTYRPMFKYWSPMSIGAWALLAFGFFSFLSFVGAVTEDPPPHERVVDRGRLWWPALRRRGAKWPAVRSLRPPSAPGRIIAASGALFGLYIAGYTGVLLAVTNRPIWSDTPLLGMLFGISATSTSAALLILLANRSGWITPGLANLHRMDAWVLALELLVLIAVIVSLGPAVRAWINRWGLLLLLVVILGMILPLAVLWRARHHRQLNVVTAPVLVLIGGFLLRVVIVFSSQAI